MPRFFLENGGKIRLFVVAQIETDFSDGLVGGGEQVLGFDEFTGLDDFGDAFLQNVIANQIEVSGRHEQFFGIKLHAFRSSEIGFEDSQKVFERGVLGGKPARFAQLGFPPLRFNHGKNCAQKVPDDRQVRGRLLHFPGKDFADRDQAVEATAWLQGDVGVVVVTGVKLKGGLGNELAFEAQHPHFAYAVFDAGQDPVDFSPRDETDEGCLDGRGFEIYEMLQTPRRADYEFLKIVVVRVVGDGGEFC